MEPRATCLGIICFRIDFCRKYTDILWSNRGLAIAIYLLSLSHAYSANSFIAALNKTCNHRFAFAQLIGIDNIPFDLFRFNDIWSEAYRGRCSWLCWNIERILSTVFSCPNWKQISNGFIWNRLVINKELFDAFDRYHDLMPTASCIMQRNTMIGYWIG